MANLDTAKKRASAINLGMAWDRPFIQLDNDGLGDPGERQAAAGLYSLESEAVVPVVFAGAFVARRAFATGLYSVIGSTTRVKPAPRVVIKTSTWLDLVKFAEGPAEFARRNRYVAYRFGGGRGPSRQFWDG